MRKNLEAFTKIIILSIWTALALFLFVTGCFQNVALEGFELTFNKASWLNNVAAIAIFAILLTVVAVILKKLGGKGKGLFHILQLLLILIAVISMVIYINNTCYYPGADPKDCLDSARQLLSGDVSSWKSGYMSLYPFQNGFVFLIALLMKIFGKNVFLFFQYINVVFLLLGAFAVWRTTGMMKDMGGEASRAASQLAMCLYFPYGLYVMFFYGIILGLTSSLLAVMWMFDYFRTGAFRYAVLTGCAITLAGLIKANYLIFFVGIILYMTYHAVAHGEPDGNPTIGMGRGFRGGLKGIVAVLLVIFIYLFGNAGMDMMVETVTGMPVSAGIPKLAWIAMGLNDEVNSAPGWWDGYNTYVYVASGNDFEKTAENSVEHIKARFKLLSSSPKRLLKFYYKKITSTWNNPTWECFNIQDLDSMAGDDYAREFFSDGGGLGVTLAKYIRTLINAGVLLYLVFCWKNFVRTSIYDLVYGVMFIGAFIFFVVWETKSQYAMPYNYICIVYAVRGWISTAGRLSLIFKA